MDIQEIYSIYLKHPNLSTDSRLIPENSIFFALKGGNFNGNQYAQQAIEKGASYAIIDEPEFAISEKFIVVDNVLQTLQKLARFHRDQLNIPIIGITGTNGKTTTKELTAAILAKKFKVDFTQGNLNNHIGVPLTLLSMNSQTEIGVVEMGANHPGEIAELCEIANPDFGLITNIGKAHLEGFGSFQGVKKTKAELYRFIEKKRGKIFLNSDNPYLVDEIGRNETITYSPKGKHGATLMGEFVNAAPFLNFKAFFPKGWLYLTTLLVGSYNLENAMAATCVGFYFGVDPLKIQEALKQYSPTNNRSQLIKTGKNEVLMDAYNANPTSMIAAIENFASINNKIEKVFILGDMLELGEVSAEEHQHIVQILEKHSSDMVILVGKHFSATSSSERLLKFESSNELKDYLKNHPLHGKFILMKGSRGIRIETILELL